MALNSTSSIALLDLICEGPIDSLVGQWNGLYLNETQVQTGDTWNVEAYSIQAAIGLGSSGHDLPLHEGSGAGLTGVTHVNEVGQEIGKNYSETLNSNNEVTARDYGGGYLVREISDPTVEYFSCLFTIPKLYSVAKEGLAKGQLFNAAIQVSIQVQQPGTTYSEVYSRTIQGISTSNYQFQTPPIFLQGTGPWRIKVVKSDLGEASFEIKYTDFVDVPQNTSVANDRGNQLIWTSYDEAKRFRVNYNQTALAGMILSTTQWDSLPTRAYLIKGKLVEIPSNAVVESDGRLTFNDAFDGSLRGPVWTTCPICCFYDLLTNPRYGAGDFINAANLSWVDLYPLSRYANQLVTNPDGTQEARFACNLVIGDQAEAYNVLQDMASIFRGLLYWSADTIQIAADHGNLDGTALSPAVLYNNSNVINGVFEYSGSSLKTRSTSIRVRYNDPENLYRPNYVVVEDSELITKYGYQVKEIVAFGCTSKWQAQRVGRWMLKSEELDGETITFSTGLQGATLLPGQIFSVADQLRQGTRLSGRVNSATTSTIIADQSISLPAGTDHTITCLLPNGTVETRAISSVSSSTINVSSAFSAAPQAQSVWSIASSSVNEQKFRCITVGDNGDGTFTITGLVHNDSIYSAVEEDRDLIFRDITTYDEAPPAPTGLNLQSRQITQGLNIINRIIAAWSRGSSGNTFKFEVRWRVGDGNYEYAETTIPSFEIDGLQPNATFLFEVRAVGQQPLNKKSDWSQITTIIPSESTTSEELITLPPDPENIRIEAFGNDQILLRWDQPNVSSAYALKAIIRHSSKTDGTGEWANSVLMSDSITASTGQAMLPFVEGEYLIKFESTDGLRSENATSAVIDLPDSIPRYDITTVREDTTSPPFQGQVDGVFYSDEYDGLVLDGQNTFDDVIDVDLLGSFDFTGTTLNSGLYYFNNILDLGGEFSVVFTRTLTTRGLYPNDTVDDHIDNIDRWSDFDGNLADDTSAELYFRTSNQATTTDEFLLEDGDFLLTEDSDNFLMESSILFGSWIPMRSGRYTGRQFQFKVELSSNSDAQTPIVDELGYIMQLESRTVSSATIASGAGAKVVTYDKPFYATPGVGITAFNLATGDYYEVTSASRTGFTVTFKNSAGTAVNRNFQYVAAGYGAEEI